MGGLFWNKTENRLRGFWRLILQYMLMILLAGIGLASAIPLFPVLKNLSTLRNPGDLVWFLNAVLMCGACFGASAIAGRIFDKRKLTDFGLRLSKEWFLELAAGLILGALLMSGIFLCEWWAGWVQIKGFFKPTHPDIPFAFSFFGALVSFFLAAFAEEILCRGYQLKNLSETLKVGGTSGRTATLLAIILSSLFFGLYHLGNPNTTWISTLNIALAGVMFSIAYLATGRLALPFGLHVAWNVFQGCVFGFPVSGMKFTPQLIAVEQLGDPLVTGGAFGPEAGYVGLAAILVGTIAIVVWARFRHKDQLENCLTELATYERP